MLFLVIKIPEDIRVFLGRKMFKMCQKTTDTTDAFKYVNEHGGWTVIGWHSCGVINDCTLTGVVNNSNSSGTNNINNAEIQFISQIGS